MSYIFLKLLKRFRFYSTVWLSVLLVIQLCNTVQSRNNGDTFNSETRTVSFETNEGTALAFDISPDGETIVFDLLGQLWTLPAEGGEAVPLTDAVADGAEDLDPNFSPDGEWIVFQSNRPEGEGLWLIPAGGGKPRILPDTEATFWAFATPDWSPDGAHVAFIYSNELRIHHLERDSTTHIELRDPPEGQLEHAAWAPDGQLVLHVSQSIGWMDDPEGVLWMVDPKTGEGRELSTGDVTAVAPAPSPDGDRLAYFAHDGEDQPQLWVQDFEDGTPLQLTDQEDVFPLRARWKPGGDEILYAAGGRLWAVDSGGGSPRRVPFSARVQFEREEAKLPAVAFPEPGEQVPTRGHMGLALAPDGQRIAKLALGQLWVWAIGEEPKAVADIPAFASWLDWSPDGNEVVWSGGTSGLEDLYVTHVETGHTRALTTLPGRVSRPAWSPDGEKMAVLYWPELGIDAEAREDLKVSPRLEVFRVGPDAVADTSEFLLGQKAPPEEGVYFWALELLAYGQEKPTWSPDSEALFLVSGLGEDGARIIPLEGEPVSVERTEGEPTFAQWAPDSSIIHVEDNLLWRSRIEDAVLSDPQPSTEDVALYPRVARDGSVLYVGADGYRVLRADGSTEALGWPLTHRVQQTSSPMLIQDAHLIDGTGSEPVGPKDLLIENGRIQQIDDPGSIRPRPDMRMIEAEGRWVVPGFIDLHQHGWDDMTYPASLYFGATTIREMGAPIARMAALAESAEAGIYPGPRVILGGFQIYPGLERSHSGASMQYPSSSESAERTLEAARMFGASYAKMRVVGRWSAGAEFVRQAHGRGMRVGGHCAFQLPLMAAGISQVQHLDGCGPRSRAHPRRDILRLYREMGLAAVPTVTAHSAWIPIHADSTLLEAPDIAPFVTPFLRWWATPGSLSIEHFERMRRGVSDAVGALHHEGIQIGTGTDAPYLPGAFHLELEELVASGLSPLEAITAATGNAAKILGADEEIGTIEEGKRADLILLDADPLEDIRNTREIYKVIKGGEIVDREGLLDWAKQEAEFLKNHHE